MKEGDRVKPQQLPQNTMMKGTVTWANKISVHVIWDNGNPKGFTYHRASLVMLSPLEQLAEVAE